MVKAKFWMFLSFRSNSAKWFWRFLFMILRSLFLFSHQGSCYVLSASEQFNEEMEIDYERLVNWLSHYGLSQYHVHVSGHMMPLQLKVALKKINAKKVFPVHTENSNLFTKFMAD